MKHARHSRDARTSVNSPAFTIVELLIVIIVIGILAAVVVVAYSGISSRSTVASLQSSLAEANNSTSTGPQL